MGDELVDKRRTFDSHIPTDHSDQKTVAEEAHHNLLSDAMDWCKENPGTATVIGTAAMAGVGYLTRGTWMPLVSKLAPAAETTILAGRGQANTEVAKTALTRLSEIAAPEMHAWKQMLGGYSDIGLDQASAMMYRGAKAGTFAENILVVNGTSEANTLFRAVSREGLLQRDVWQRGAAGTAAEFGEVTLPGKTRFFFEEGKALDIPAGGKLIDMRNGQFQAHAKDAAEKLFVGLQKF